MNGTVRFRAHQRGAALVLALLLLALLTLLVTNAWSENRWQQRITSHEISEARAETAARSALRWAEAWLMSRPGDTRPATCVGECIGASILASGGLGAGLDHQGERWWLDHGHADGFDPQLVRQLSAGRVPGTPAGRWIIEEAHFDADGSTGPDTPAISYYRIVARAARAPGGPPVILESVIARPWGQAEWADTLPVSGDGFCRQPDAPAHCGRLSWRRRQ